MAPDRRETTSDDVRETTAGACMYVGNGLEAYRVDTFETREAETVAWIRDFMREGERFVDVGANVGIYSVFAALVHPGLEVFAFEPYLPNFNRLRENVALNRLDNVIALPVAISDRAALTTFFTADDRVGGSGGQVGERVDQHGEIFEPVDQHPVLALPLDHCIHTLGLPVPEHVKIDVDGAESHVLAGMSQTLADARVRSIVVEVSESSSDVGAIRKLLESRGFTFDNVFERHPQHSRQRRSGTRSASAVNLVAVRAGDAEPGKRP